MNQTIKTAAFTFSGLLLISLISLSWKAHEQARREAELRQFCDNLAQYTFSVNQRGDKASEIELMTGAYTQSLNNINCQQYRR